MRHFVLYCSHLCPRDKRLNLAFSVVTGLHRQRHAFSRNSSLETFSSRCTTGRFGVSSLRVHEETRPRDVLFTGTNRTDSQFRWSIDGSRSTTAIVLTETGRFQRRYFFGVDDVVQSVKYQNSWVWITLLYFPVDTTLLVYLGMMVDALSASSTTSLPSGILEFSSFHLSVGRSDVHDVRAPIVERVLHRVYPTGGIFGHDRHVADRPRTVGRRHHLQRVGHPFLQLKCFIWSAHRTKAGRRGNSA